jgi:acyl-CoA synthetase (AMP-forming)/AMP-acid ligase II
MPALRALHGGRRSRIAASSARDVDREPAVVPPLHVWRDDRGADDHRPAWTANVEARASVSRRARQRGRGDRGGRRRARFAAHGESGELLIRGSAVCCGYTDPEVTAQAFTEDGFLRTGDVGYRCPDGRLVLTGAKKELIIRKGEDISPTEVEQVLIQLPKIADVAVIGLPDDERGELACAVAGGIAGEPVALCDLTLACREAGLATYKIPERLELVESLPRNAMMRCRRTSCARRFSVAITALYKGA